MQQKIDVFESETKLPLDIAIMVDTSFSARKEIVFEREAASNFIKQVLQADDRLGVFYFDETVTQNALFLTMCRRCRMPCVGFPKVRAPQFTTPCC